MKYLRRLGESQEGTGELKCSWKRSQIKVFLEEIPMERKVALRPGSESEGGRLMGLESLFR